MKPAINPQPKKPAVRLYGKARHKFKMDLYENRALRGCETCGKFVPLNGTVFEIAHLSHIIPRKRGGDTPENCLIECYSCHIEDRHGPKWSKGGNQDGARKTDL